MRSVQFPKQRRRRIWAPQYFQKFDSLRHFKSHLKNTNFEFEPLKKLLNFIGIISYYKYFQQFQKSLFEYLRLKTTESRYFLTKNSEWSSYSEDKSILQVFRSSHRSLTQRCPGQR